MNWAIIGAITGVCGFVFGVYQWFRTRRRWLHVTYEVRKLGHVRYFLAHVQNRGTDFYDAGAVMRFRRDGTETDHPLSLVGEAANPLRWLQSRTFYLTADEPHVPQNWEKMAPEDVELHIYSDQLPAKTIKGKRFKMLLDEYSKADPNMPPKPPRDQSGYIDPGEWLQGRPMW